MSVTFVCTVVSLISSSTDPTPRSLHATYIDLGSVAQTHQAPSILGCLQLLLALFEMLVPVDWDLHQDGPLEKERFKAGIGRWNR